MSLESWKAEFYPVEADHVPKEEAIAHSLRKWEGLRPANLRKHGVVKIYNYGGLLDEQYPTAVGFSVDSDSCALCVLYADTNCNCGSCPVACSRGNTPCDECIEDEKCSPYESFRRESNPEPMIQALEGAQRWEQA